MNYMPEEIYELGDEVIVTHGVTHYNQDIADWMGISGYEGTGICEEEAFVLGKLVINDDYYYIVEQNNRKYFIHHQNVSQLTTYEFTIYEVEVKAASPEEAEEQFLDLMAQGDFDYDIS